MNIKSQNLFFTITGLSLGLVATLYGMNISSAIEATPTLMGSVSAVWCAVSASIVGGMTSKYENH